MAFTRLVDVNVCTVQRYMEIMHISIYIVPYTFVHHMYMYMGFLRGLYPFSSWPSDGLEGVCINLSSVWL